MVNLLAFYGAKADVLGEGSVYPDEAANNRGQSEVANAIRRIWGPEKG